MRPNAQSASARATAAAFILATPLVSAITLPSLPSLDPRRLSRRADEESTIPAALNIAAAQNWDGNDGPWSSFPLQVGNRVQNVRVQIGTAATSVVTVSAEGCPGEYGPNCGDSRGLLFYPNESLTWIENSIFNIGINNALGLDTQADAGFDTVTIGWQGSTTATVEHNVVFNADSATYWLGLFGLNPRPTNFTTYTDPQPSFIQQLVNNGTIPSLSWGYTAGNQYRFNRVLGSLVLGGYDEDRFDTNSKISMGFNTDISRDLLVNVQAIATDAGSPSNLLPDGSIPMFLDSTVGPMWLPESACEAFEQAFGLTYDETSTFYLVNDSLHDTLVSTNANVTFRLGTQSTGGETVDIILPYGAFDLTLAFPNIMNPNSSHYFPLKRATDESQYKLGRTFFQEAYVIADYDRQNFTVAPCQWATDPSSQNTIRSILRSNETSTDDGGSSSNTGAIAGGVVGGVVGAIAIAGLALFLVRRKKQTEKKRLAELDAKSADGTAGADKASSDGSEVKPFISAPIGGELGGGEIHELNTTYKLPPQEMDSPYKVDPNKHGYSEMGVEHGEFFAPSKGVPAEIRNNTPIYEMAGSDVHEIGTSQQVDITDRKK